MIQCLGERDPNISLRLLHDPRSYWWKGQDEESKAEEEGLGHRLGDCRNFAGISAGETNRKGKWLETFRKALASC